MKNLRRSPRKHIRPGALCKIVAKRRKATLRSQTDWEDTTLESPVVKKRSSLRKFSTPANVVIDSPPVSTRASSRRMIYNTEPNQNDIVEDVEMSHGSSRTRRSLNYQVEEDAEMIFKEVGMDECENIVDKEVEDLTKAEFEGIAEAECEMAEAIRAKFQERRKKVVPHTLSRRGYARTIDDMKKDTKEEKVSRIEAFRRAHTKKNGEPINLTASKGGKATPSEGQSLNATQSNNNLSPKNIRLDFAASMLMLQD
ncbi:hypothetical protein F8388_012381 [Cannabis sativa]|uniref:Uncharacterized protein n=1 Tax=Cannabis sativa TaxID=3483 RepID=A0A7J6G5A5_CANSA|nr:hypothetical protein F8388_012381 [Cannabis sativa]